MRGPLYDYKNQRWTEVDTDTDRRGDGGSYITSDGVEYEVNPANPSEYRNRPADYQARTA